jgi:hypothetical protein
MRSVLSPLQELGRRGPRLEIGSPDETGDLALVIAASRLDAVVKPGGDAAEYYTA